MKQTYKEKRELQKLNHKIHNDLIKKQLDKARLEEDNKEIKYKIKQDTIPEETQDNDKTLIDDFETQLNANEPIRELFTGKNIKFKTQLTEEQRSSVSILYHAWKQCEKYGIEFDGLKFVLDEYIDFGVSIDRKGRTEFVTAQQSINTQNNLQNQGNNPNNVNNMNNMKL